MILRIYVLHFFVAQLVDLCIGSKVMGAIPNKLVWVNFDVYNQMWQKKSEKKSVAEKAWKTPTDGVKYN